MLDCQITHIFNSSDADDLELRKVHAGHVSAQVWERKKHIKLKQTATPKPTTSASRSVTAILCVNDEKVTGGM
jgi:hypothetical protein